MPTSLPSQQERQPRRQPQRTCIACRDTGDKRGLTRLVRVADGQVQADLSGRLPGRGAYLCGQRQCWERALARGEMLGRALRTTIAPEARDALLASAPAASAPAASAPAASVSEPAGSPIAGADAEDQTR